METRDFDLTDPDAAAFCPACGAGYTSQVRECADCGVALVPKSQVENELRRDHDQEASFAVSDPDLPALCPFCGTEYTSASRECIDCRVALIPQTQIQKISVGSPEATQLPEFFLSNPDDEASSLVREEEPSTSVFRELREQARKSSARDHFTGPASIWKVVWFGIVSALTTAYSAAELLRGERPMPVIATAIFSGLFAMDNWRRLNANDLLPRRFRCPDCDAPIRLSTPERALTTFSCKECGEDFEVEG